MPPDANPPTHSLPPREPEIEFLGKVVRFGLLALRGVTVIAAICAIAYGFVSFGEIRPFIGGFDGGIPRNALFYAPSVVWFCIGIPPLLPVKWLFGRGRWPMLALGVALWFGPMWLDCDHEYGWLLRFFSTVVALSVLFVWKTIFALTQSRAGSA